ncbi:MAG: bacterial regulatory helix-turn-helix protein AraC family protein 43 [Ramlibacter sp.]|nr:bacterial regulatory helix-turn-helix protein AraC family protein 43 [Ramlibacter sp.]
MRATGEKISLTMTARKSAPQERKPPADTDFSNYRMSERASHLDFGIRSQDTALPNPAPHRHEYLQIHVQLQGTTRHFLDGGWRPVVPGTLCFILPFKTHFIPTVPDSRYFILNVSLHYLLPALDVDALDLLDVPIERAPELALFRFQPQLDFVLDARAVGELTVICAAIMKEDAERAAGSTIMIRGYLLQLIGLVWRHYGERLQQLSNAQPSAAAGRQTMARLLAYLRDHVEQPVSLSDAASAVHLSPTYLAHLVKRETGKTFIELLTGRRIARARELLVHTDLSVKEIAYRSGFTDVAYFSRRFRQFEGCTPVSVRGGLQAGVRV